MREVPTRPEAADASTAGLLILGMHRSGTSAISNLTADLGYRLPADEIPALADNVEGFGESRGLALFNDTVMAALGGSWHSPPPVKQEWKALADEVRVEALEAFETAFGPGAGSEGSPWVWKDPRVCITLPFWRALLGDRPVRALLVFRNPHSVAASLSAANRGPERFQSVEFGMALWERYNLALFDNLRSGDEVLGIDFDRLLSDDEYRTSLSDELARFVAPHLDVTPEETRAAVDARIKTRLVNTREEDGTGTPEGPQAVLDLLRERTHGLLVTDFSSRPESRATSALLKAHRRCRRDRPCEHRGQASAGPHAAAGAAAGAGGVTPAEAPSSTTAPITRVDAAERPPSYVVVPVKDRNDLTRRLIADLHRQAQYAAVYVFDNGSKKKNRKELEEFVKSLGDQRIRVYDAQGWNLHRMWNQGIANAARHASKQGWKAFDVAVLNNDLHVGDDFLGALSDSLRSEDDLWAVSPNYDNRPLEGIQFVRNIAAGREDGTGGLAGFAFVVRGEAFAVADAAIGTLEFDEGFRWWFGDSDFACQVMHAGKRLGITGATTVIHVDGGSQTTASNSEITETSGGSRRFRPEFAEIIAGDRSRFEEKWGVKVGSG